MSFLDSVVSACRNLYGKKMRSALTAIGIIIGVASVILITSVGQGFQNMVQGEFDKMGALGLLVHVRGDKVTSVGDLLTLDDLAVIREHPAVRSAAPVAQNDMRVRLKNPQEQASCIAVGTTAEYARTVSSVDMLHGRFLAAQDEGRAAGVCVIDEQLSVKAFGRSDSVGESIHASTSQGARDLVVVGVYKVEGLEAMFTSQSTVYLPITAQLAMFHQETVDYVGVSVDAEAGLDRTAQELVAMLGIKHRNREAYSAENVMSQMETINTVMTGITAFVSLVALVSLVVGGIGVMNIMLITVTERTKEIGIRKALGATDGNIRLQFLVESVVLTALGGLAGVLLGYYGGFAVSGMIPQVQITPEVSPTMIGVSVAVSSLIGVIFGVYPASKAASLNPIDALRSE